MGIGINNRIYTKELARITQKLALKRAKELQKAFDGGEFDNGKRTVDIEQEVFIVDKETGEPVDIESLMLKGTFGIRPDTTVYTLEYDANGITPVTVKGIRGLLNSFKNKTKNIQQLVTKATNGRGIIVCIGTQPLVGDEYLSLIVRDPVKRKRYEALEEATFVRENRQKEMVIRNDITGEELRSRASNLSAMSRCAATQLHLAYPTIRETLEAYNISIAIAGPLITMFSNSPYASGIDTGLVNSRIEMLSQAEQKRAGLAKPAASIFDHFQNTLNQCMPPFIETDDPEKALDLAYGAMHISTRIRLDEQSGTSRIELRVLDSLTPYRGIQALLLTIGIIESLRGQKLSTYPESLINFKEGRKGLNSAMKYLGQTTDAKSLILKLIDLAKKGLCASGLGELAEEFLDPLEKEAMSRITQADLIRQNVSSTEKKGVSRRIAIATMLRGLNKSMLEEN